MADELEHVCEEEDVWDAKDEKEVWEREEEVAQEVEDAREEEHEHRLNGLRWLFDFEVSENLGNVVSRLGLGFKLVKTPEFL